MRRSIKDITVIAVTKTATTDQIKQLVDLGHLDPWGIARAAVSTCTAQIDEWLARQQGRKAGHPEKNLPPASAMRWHMIGHLHRNKVRAVMSLCKMIHSVDSLRLAEEIHEEAERYRRHSDPPPVPRHRAAWSRWPRVPMQILLEVNVAGESSKFGVAVGAALHLAEQIDTMDDIHLVGLM